MKCKFCGSTNMESRGSYDECPSCGGTHTDLPKLACETVVREKDPLSGRDIYRPGPAARKR